MGERSGIGQVEVTILEALESLGARSDRRCVKCSQVAVAVEDSIGLGPGYSHEVLCDLARPWTALVRLVDFHGNYGSRDFPAAGSRYVEARLSPAGEVALAAERGDLAPVPIGLINGTTYSQGSRPPFHPLRVVKALRRLISRPDVTAQELVDIIGPPCFPTGCLVDGDLVALASGEPTTLRLQARVNVDADTNQIWIEDLAPSVGRIEVMEAIAKRAQNRPWHDDYPELESRTRLPISTIDDRSSGEHDLIVCAPEPGTPLEALRDRLIDIHGISIALPVALTAPLGTILREWVHRYNNDLEVGFATLESAIARLPPPIKPWKSTANPSPDPPNTPVP